MDLHSEQPPPVAGCEVVTHDRRRRRLPVPGYGIARVEQGERSFYGWVVTLQRKGVIYRKGFSDVSYGGRNKALRAASKWRDEVIKSTITLSRKEYSAIVRRSNRSGVPGVCRVVEETRTGKKVALWMAFWPTSYGKSRRAKYSVAKHGEDHAFELARARRAAELEKLSDEEFAVSRLHREFLQQR